MLDTTRTQTLSEPAAVVTALWLQAWLRGQAGADDLLTVLARIAPDVPSGLHREGRTLPAADLLARLRSAAVTYAWPVLPRPGRVVGWPVGVADEPCPSVLLVRAAASTDELPLAEVALLSAGSGGWLLDDLRPAAATGAPAAPPAASTTPGPVAAIAAHSLSPRAATRRFTELIDDAAADLARLGLDRPARTGVRQRWAEALADLPATVDPQLVSLLLRCGLVLDALGQALLDDGAAVTAGEARTRSGRLHRLDAELTELVPAAVAGAVLAAAERRP